MTHAHEYNQAQYDKGRLTMQHVTRMTRLWQRENDLPEDGMCGPDTQATLEEISSPIPCPSVLGVAWTHARADIGKGGDGITNNEGAYLDEIRGFTGLSKLGAGAWCAVAVSSWIKRADLDIGDAVKSRSAKLLVQNILDVGAFEIEPEDVRAGETVVALYSRGNISDGLHHVRLASLRGDGIWDCIGGNEAGDLVRFRARTPAEFDRRLVKLARF